MSKKSDKKGDESAKVAAEGAAKTERPDAAAAGAEAAEPAKKTKETPPKPAKPSKDSAGKKKGIPWVLVLVPVALVAALVLAFTLPPTHAIIMKSPLGPLLARFDHTPAKGGAAVAAKAQDPAAQVKELNDALAAEKKNGAAKDQQIAALQAEVKPPQAAPADASPSPKPTATGVPADVKRAAEYWAGMDADKAVDIIKQLPDNYVKAVFSQMPADAVADIMSALPPKTAARLTADGSENAP